MPTETTRPHGCVRVLLPRGLEAFVDKQDAHLFESYRWTVTPARHTHYLQSRMDGSELRWVHRVILDAPAGVEVDHANGNGLDNRRMNLRLATEQRNKANQPKRRGASRYKGVSWSVGRELWQAHCTRRDGGTRYLGCFESEVEAARAYDAAALEMYGEFALTNFGAVEIAAPIVGRTIDCSAPWKAAGATSQYRGVSFLPARGKWQATIGGKRGERQQYLGLFVTEEEAARSYDLAAWTRWHDIARLNFPERVRCGCCDGVDGLGVHHFADVDQLRRFLDADHEHVCDIDVACVPDEPWGMAFVTAGEARAWLEDHDEQLACDLAWERQLESVGGRAL